MTGPKKITELDELETVPTDIDLYYIPVRKVSGTEAQRILLTSVMPKRVKKSLTSGEILNSYAVPIECVPSPGEGKAIRVLSASVRINEGTAYATHLQLQLFTNVGFPCFQTIATFLDNGGADAPAHQPFYIISAATGEDDMIVENAPLMVKTKTGNPTAGNFPVDIYITYEVIAL